MNHPGGQIFYVTVLFLALVIVFGVASPSSLSIKPFSLCYVDGVTTSLEIEVGKR